MGEFEPDAPISHSTAVADTAADRVDDRKGEGMSVSMIKPRVATVDTARGSAPAVERIRGRALDRIRKRILLRDSYTCRDCGRVSVRLEIDHEVPLSLGGAESDENRAARCTECHRLKSEREEKGRNERGSAE